MAEAPSLWALGLMSGTSMDGIDAALIRTDGHSVQETGPYATYPYAPAFRERLRGVLGGRDDVAGAERALTDLHAEAVEALLRSAGRPASSVDVIGFHGQTVLHAPAARRTWQIGDGQRLADRIGRDVVFDFRSADVAAGGEGAPLAPVFHAALARGLSFPLAVLNIGGVANVTWIGGPEDLLAFDTGPGNALLDDWARRHTGRAFDEDGALARSGRVREDIVHAVLRRKYFGTRPPKSLDRGDFTLDAVSGLSPPDGAATLAALTAAAVAASRDHMKAAPRRWLVTGGGRLNPAIMAVLRARLGVPVEAVEEVGWNGDALEAQAFGFLAVRSLRGLPLSFPSTTRAPRPLTGGRLARPKKPSP